MLSAELSAAPFGASHLVNVRDQIVVREHDSFGQACGAAGVGKSWREFARED